MDMTETVDQPGDVAGKVAGEAINAPVRRSTIAARQVSYDVLLLDAQARQSVATVRSLGSRRLQVAAMDTCRNAPAFSSRWCQQQFRAPSYEQSEEPYVAYLEKLLDDVPVRVLIPASDGTIAALRAHRERLERRVCIALAKEPALGIAINKEETLAIARRLRLGIPQGVAVGETSELSAALREIGLPAVIKPMQSWVHSEHSGTRVAPRLVTTPDEARQAVETLERLGAKRFFCQQFLSGVREAVSFLYAHGNVYARFAQQTRRSHPPLGGTSVLRQSIEVPPDIGDQAERLVREIDLEGIAEVEFRRDGAGNPYLMEINPRLWASTELAVRAGVDFPYLLYQWAIGDKIDFVMGYRAGVWLRHLSDDLETTVASLLQRGRPGLPPPAVAIRDFCLDFFKPTAFEYASWKDPLPAITAAAGFLPHALRQIRKELP
jgi:predicted ATP-grasp superfamily ATP-dependent carboligase